MKMVVLVAIRDFPKRGDFSRQSVEVTAPNDANALVLGEAEARKTWPGAKVRAYDILFKPDTRQQAKRGTLKLKVATA